MEPPRNAKARGDSEVWHVGAVADRRRRPRTPNSNEVAVIWEIRAVEPTRLPNARSSEAIWGFGAVTRPKSATRDPSFVPNLQIERRFVATCSWGLLSQQARPNAEVWRLERVRPPAAERPEPERRRSDANPSDGPEQTTRAKPGVARPTRPRPASSDRANPRPRPWSPPAGRLRRPRRAPGRPPPRGRCR